MQHALLPARPAGLVVRYSRTIWPRASFSTLPFGPASKAKPWLWPKIGRASVAAPATPRNVRRVIDMRKLLRAGGAKLAAGMLVGLWAKSDPRLLYLGLLRRI